MLTKRTQLLLDNQDWHMLSSLASQKGESIGQLIRRAIKNTYREPTLQNQRQTAYQTIMKNRQKHSHLDYKALINYGREF